MQRLGHMQNDFAMHYSISFNVHIHDSMVLAVCSTATVGQILEVIRWDEWTVWLEGFKIRFEPVLRCLLAAVLCPTRHLPSPGKLVSGRNVIPHLSHLLGLLVAVAFFSLEGKVSTALRFKKPVLIMGGESGSHGFVHKAQRNVVKPCNNELHSVFIRT